MIAACPKKRSISRSRPPFHRCLVTVCVVSQIRPRFLDRTGIFFRQPIPRLSEVLVIVGFPLAIDVFRTVILRRTLQEPAGDLH